MPNTFSTAPIKKKFVFVAKLVVYNLLHVVRSPKALKSESETGARISNMEPPVLLHQTKLVLSAIFLVALNSKFGALKKDLTLEKMTNSVKIRS
jgi:hypothetical protein